MRREFLVQQKQRLAAMLLEIQRRADSHRREVEELQEQRGEEFHGNHADHMDGTSMVDVASLDYDIELALISTERDRKAMTKIMSTFARIENGGYGICVECGEEIPEKRLEAEPTVIRCFKCQTDHERRAH